MQVQFNLPECTSEVNERHEYVTTASLNVHLTLQLPWVTKEEFLLTTSVQYQADKWQE